MKFLAVANITQITELVNVLKAFAQEIVSKFKRRLSFKNITCKGRNEVRRSFWRMRQFFTVRHKNACVIIHELNSFFHPWKCLRTAAQRHFFVQEGGFEALLEVLEFSSQMFHDFKRCSKM